MGRYMQCGGRGAGCTVRVIKPQLSADVQARNTLPTACTYTAKLRHAFMDMQGSCNDGTWANVQCESDDACVRQNEW
jgi:hypothetical protein